jgi:hypothetical protein
MRITLIAVWAGTLCATVAQAQTNPPEPQLVQAICVDPSFNPHPASQTFAERDVGPAYVGEIFRCMSGTQMRFTLGGATYYCAAREALWYENATMGCREQIERRPANERALLRQFGPGDKSVLVSTVVGENYGEEDD